MTLEDDAIALHRILKGKIGIQSKVTANFARPSSVNGAEGNIDQGVNEKSNDGKKVDNFGILELIYTPGVDAVAEAISSNKKLV